VYSTERAPTGTLNGGGTRRLVEERSPQRDTPRVNRPNNERRSATRVAAWYATFGMAWIVVSELFLVWRSPDAADSMGAQLAKGCAFILVSAALIFLITFRDARRRRIAESESRRGAETLRAYIESAPLGIVGVDALGTVQLWNPAAEQIFGWSEKEVMGEPLPVVPRERLQEMWSHFDRTASGDSLVGVQVKRLRKDGRSVDVSVWTSAIRDENGELTGVVAAYADMTEWNAARRRIRTQYKRLAALRTIDLAITRSLDLNHTLSVIVDQAVNRLRVDGAAVLIADRATGMLHHRAGRGLRNGALTSRRVCPYDGSPAGVAAGRQAPVIVPDLAAGIPGATAHALRDFQIEGFAAYFAAPMIAKGAVVGVLELFGRKPRRPDEDWVQFFEAIAGQAAIAVDSARLFEDLQRSNASLADAYDATLEGWSRAMDLRDHETEGHSQRVAYKTVELARLLGFDEDALVHVWRGALLHDIGKMGVPDAILHKPGPLDAREWEIMKLHPVLAYELLSPINFLERALDIPYCHHEKWDGSGYPRGLAGEEIPLAARVFAVVDVWDAFLSNRPYRRALPEPEVKSRIRALAGSHFDPEVVDKFLQMDWGLPARLRR